MTRIGIRFLTIAIVSIMAFAENATTQTQKENRVKSPNDSLAVEVRLNSAGTPVFDIFYGGQCVMGGNILGVEREDADFSKDMRLVSSSEMKSITDHYTLLYGKKLSCSYRANSRVFHFKNRAEAALDIIFDVANDGVAFRYFFPGISVEIRKIRNERTFFNFDDSTIAWIQPMSAAKSGWHGVNPSYEEHYLQEMNITALPKSGPGWVFPALFKSGKYWISLTETAPNRDYCGCRLIHDSASTGFAIGFPQEAEVFPGGSLKPESRLPWNSPWRIIALGSNLRTIFESTLGTDLAAPSLLSDVSFVKPGRSSWSWVLYKDDSTVAYVQRRFIDYASDMGWEYCLVDADWDRRIGYDTLGELCRYAKRRNVGINVWYNSAGSWNTTPYTPRDKMLTKESRETEFRKIAALGVKGIKVDFFGADGQSMMSYYQDIIEDAARYGLMVNCHGSTLPRGWERTYPNLVSMEAIKGFEFVTFDQSNANKEASHCAVIPFTRNLYDPMDFTPVCFSEVPNIQRKTTNAFELALSVLFVSGVQHFAEVPEGMARVPGEVRQVMKEVPVAWDETRLVDGYPGKYIAVARRKGKDWFIAAINGEATARSLHIDLAFVGTFATSVFITSGNSSRSFNIEKEKVDVSKPITVDLKPNDGFVYLFSDKN